MAMTFVVIHGSVDVDRIVDSTELDVIGLWPAVSYVGVVALAWADVLGWPNAVNVSGVSVTSVEVGPDAVDVVWVTVVP